MTCVLTCFHLSLTAYQGLCRPGWESQCFLGSRGWQWGVGSSQPWQLVSRTALAHSLTKLSHKLLLDDKQRHLYSCWLLTEFVFHAIAGKLFKILILFDLNFDCGFIMLLFLINVVRCLRNQWFKRWDLNVLISNHSQLPIVKTWKGTYLIYVNGWECIAKLITQVERHSLEEM